VAGVVLLDDSASTAAGRLRPAIDAMKECAAAYVDTLRDGDEVSVLRLSQLGTPSMDPLFDREAAKSLIEATVPTDVASNIPGLVEAGLAQLAKHRNSEAEVVLVSDGLAEGWHHDERARWAQIRRAFRRSDTAAGGHKPRLIVVGPRDEMTAENVAVEAITFDGALVPSGRPASVRVALRCDGARAREGARLRLSVDGRTVDERELRLEQPGLHEFAFTHTFQEAGSHVVEASVEGMRDSFERDDARAVSIEVTERLPVLLIEGAQGPRLSGSLGLFAVALDPTGDGGGLFDVDRVGASAMIGVRLQDYRTIVLGDVPALEAGVVADIERFVVTGGGVLVGLGPQTDPALVNRFWARGGDGFLPAPLAQKADLDPPGTPRIGAPSHPALRAFAGQGGEAFKGATVRTHWRLDTAAVKSGSLSTLLDLEDGSPLVVERPRGHGHIAMLTTSLDLSWSELAVQPAYVPLVRGLVEYLGSAVLPPRNLRPGDRLTHVGETGAPVSAAEGPRGAFVALERGGWEGRSAFVSSFLTDGGIYRVYEGTRNVPTYYVVALDPAESTFVPLAVEDREQVLAGLDGLVLSGADELRRVLDPAARRDVEVWPALVLMALALLFGETLLTRRQAAVEGRAAARATPSPKAVRA
jgi:hypothetical protein